MDATDQKKTDGSGVMFDRIAARYDLLNRLISFGLDRGWRRRLVRALGCSGPAKVLDVATGTGDVALTIAQMLPESTVTGVDPSVGMLEIGRQKVSAAGLGARVDLQEGDAQAMPFEAGSFDAACISFGIRNVPDRLAGVREMTRVTRSGGRVVILELGEPNPGLFGGAARLHMDWLVPRLGALLTDGDAYRYLRESIAAFPPPESFAGLMREAGLSAVRYDRLSFGVATLYLGDAP
jgi:demethylmenaquinone methyltransferase/2-methoxy-6-polyprenyl-1,4-benzoquinol methylase